MTGPCNFSSTKSGRDLDLTRISHQSSFQASEIAARETVTIPGKGMTRREESAFYNPCKPKTGVEGTGRAQPPGLAARRNTKKKPAFTGYVFHDHVLNNPDLKAVKEPAPTRRSSDETRAKLKNAAPYHALPKSQRDHKHQLKSDLNQLIMYSIHSLFHPFVGSLSAYQRLTTTAPAPRQRPYAEQAPPLHPRSMGSPSNRL